MVQESVFAAVSVLSYMNNSQERFTGPSKVFLHEVKICLIQKVSPAAVCFLVGHHHRSHGRLCPGESPLAQILYKHLYLSLCPRSCEPGACLEMVSFLNKEGICTSPSVQSTLSFQSTPCPSHVLVHTVVTL